MFAVLFIIGVIVGILLIGVLFKYIGVIEESPARKKFDYVPLPPRNERRKISYPSYYDHGYSGQCDPDYYDMMTGGDAGESYHDGYGDDGDGADGC